MKKATGIKEARIIRYYHPGSYKGSLYSAAPLETAPATINLININADGVEMMATPQFLYLWQ